MKKGVKKLLKEDGFISRMNNCNNLFNILEKLKMAADDLRFLINRGYNKKVALEFVSNHYLLEKKYRILLDRVIYSDDDIKRRERKILSEDKINDRTLVIDGFNVLITTEAMHVGHYIFLSDDKIYRDLEQIFSRYKIKKYTKDVLYMLFYTLLDLNPEKVTILFDEQISRSRMIANICRNILSRTKLKFEVRTSKNVDYELIKISSEENDVIICSSDSVIADKARFLFDIPGYLVKLLNYNRVFVLK